MSILRMCWFWPILLFCFHKCFLSLQQHSFQENECTIRKKDKITVLYRLFRLNLTKISVVLVFTQFLCRFLFNFQRMFSFLRDLFDWDSFQLHMPTEKKMQFVSLCCTDYASIFMRYKHVKITMENICMYLNTVTL